MTASSLRPMRRFRTSSRPAAASNDQPVVPLTSGTGNGQASLPRTSSLRPGPMSPSRQPSAAAASEHLAVPPPGGRRRRCRRGPGRSGPKRATRPLEVVRLDGVDERVGPPRPAWRRRAGRLPRHERRRPMRRERGGDREHGAAASCAARSSWSLIDALRPPPRPAAAALAARAGRPGRAAARVAREGVGARAAALAARAPLAARRARRGRSTCRRRARARAVPVLRASWARPCASVRRCSRCAWASGVPRASCRSVRCCCALSDRSPRCSRASSARSDRSPAMSSRLSCKSSRASSRFSYQSSRASSRSSYQSSQPSLYM